MTLSIINAAKYFSSTQCIHAVISGRSTYMQEAERCKTCPRNPWLSLAESSMLPESFDGAESRWWTLSTADRQHACMEGV